MSTFSLSKTFSLGKWVSICTQCTHSQNDVMLMLLNTNDKIAHARAVFYWERKLIFTTYYKNSLVRKCVRFEEYFMRNAHKVSTQQYFSACRMWWKLNRSAYSDDDMLHMQTQHGAWTQKRLNKSEERKEKGKCKVKGKHQYLYI